MASHKDIFQRMRKGESINDRIKARRMERVALKAAMDDLVASAAASTPTPNPESE